MYRYADVERALASVNGVSEGGMGAFRGRIKHLQRIGVVPASPGKGQKLVYELEHVLKWAFCLQLAEFGVDPVRIRELASHVWNAVSVGLHSTKKEPAFFVIRPSFMSGGTDQDSLQLMFEKTPDNLLVRRASTVSLDEIDRALLINLTWLGEQVRSALGAPHRA